MSSAPNPNACARMGCQGCSAVSRCKLHDAEPYPFDWIDGVAFWVVVCAACVATVVVVCGVAGFLYATFGV